MAAKIKAPAALPAELLAHLERMWPTRTIAERTIWIDAHEGTEFMIDLIEKKIREDFLEAAVEQRLAVLKINPPRWYRRAAERVDRGVFNDANPIPAQRTDVLWTRADPLRLTDVLICRFSAEAVPALIEAPTFVEEVPADGQPE
ncbi:hypothetical protein GCM10027258_62760 [Amycolatopsis stemonae]